MNSLERGSQAAITGGGESRGKSPHGRGESTEHKEQQLQAAREHSELLTMIHMKYKQKMMGKETGGKPRADLNASPIAWP